MSIYCLSSVSSVHSQGRAIKISLTTVLGAAEAFIAKYAEWINSHGVDLTSAQPSEWAAS